MKELKEIIFEIDMKIYELNKNGMTPQIVIENFIDARNHLRQAIKILNEGGDY
tara:strand:- start:93 stop:251 length:159 start_codon:yes stop_codon:yes gene_type:complete